MTVWFLIFFMVMPDDSVKGHVVNTYSSAVGCDTAAELDTPTGTLLICEEHVLPGWEV